MLGSSLDHIVDILSARTHARIDSRFFLIASEALIFSDGSQLQLPVTEEAKEQVLVSGLCSPYAESEETETATYLQTMNVLDHILQLLVDQSMRLDSRQTLELLGAELDRVEASAAACLTTVQTRGLDQHHNSSEPEC